MEEKQKPPLGPKPRFLYEQDCRRFKNNRIIELKDAIRRFLNHDCPVKIEWVAEYNELINNKQ